jgi:hypothetical protein
MVSPFFAQQAPAAPPGQAPCDAQSCGRRRARLKPASPFQSDNGHTLMVAIGIIAIFLVVILGLNKFEFGRFD